MKKRRWKKALALAVAAALFLQGVPVQFSGTVRAQEPGDAQEPGEENGADALEEDVERLLDFVKEKWDAGEFSDGDGIEDALAQGEAQFGVTLGEETREQLADALEKLDSLGLSHETAIETAKKLCRAHGAQIAQSLQDFCDRYGEELTGNAEAFVREQLTGPLQEAVKEQLVEPAKDAVKAAVKETARDFWRDLKESVRSFFRNLFS